MELDVKKPTEDKVKILIETREVQLPRGHNFTDNQMMAYSSNPKTQILKSEVEIREVASGEVELIIQELMAFNLSQRQVARSGGETLKFKLLTTK